MQRDSEHKDINPQETMEWQEAIEDVLQREDGNRVNFLLKKTIQAAYDAGAIPPDCSHTPYLNSIPVNEEVELPGDPRLEKRLRDIMRWNAAAMVVRANRKPASPGGHIASYQSSALLYETGFNHFWRAPGKDASGDLIYIQGHVAPGIYARAYLEGRLSEEQLDRFRTEVDGDGLPSYPHPWLLPEFWQFPTVSMGLGPIMAIYQARFMKYLEHRGLIPASDRKVWAFLGDGEMDEPESQGAIALAVREKLDNLIFVINCNLQRLDGPVRGNGKIIQELEGNFRGTGWDVIKVIWGSGWDKLLSEDHDDLLRKRMEECLDGEYQMFKARGGGYIREHFFGKYPDLKKRVEHMTDDEIYYGLVRGGHDPKKVYSAYNEAVHNVGRPTVILAKTVKGYGMGEAGEGMNIAHQQKKLASEQLIRIRDRFDLPISDDDVVNANYYKPETDSEEIKYLLQCREKLGGSLPVRRTRGDSLEIPDLSLFEALLKASGERSLSTTMALVRILVTIARHKTLGPRLVPIIPDEARTFGMEGMFRQIGIYAPDGQLYTPMDADEIMPYREDSRGQILQEGINEAGAMSSWIAAATSYSNYGISMIPVYAFYSMFGFQRVGDLAWAAGDIQARGFLIGATAGRTTLNGEGLQHQDGHSQVTASGIPNCISYDPTYQYELAVIMHDGLRRMYQEQENVYYYITTMNENYVHPEMPSGSEEGILKGLYLLHKAKSGRKKAAPRVRLMGSGSILNEVVAASDLLLKDFGVIAEVWSATSFNLLARDGQEIERWNMLHPDAEPRVSYVEQCLGKTKSPVIAATDYVRSFAEQIRAYVPATYYVLGTDGFGRSDSRENLRRFFEVDRYYITLKALTALVNEGILSRDTLSKAIEKYQIDTDKLFPLYL